MVLLLLDVLLWASYSSDKAGDAKLGGADAVVVAKGSAALADHHRLHVARHRVQPSLGHTGRFRQEGHSVGLQHHLVALVGLRLQPHIGGGGGGEGGGGDYLLWNYLDGWGWYRVGLAGWLDGDGNLLLLLGHLCHHLGRRSVHTCRSCRRWRWCMPWWRS